MPQAFHVFFGQLLQQYAQHVESRARAPVRLCGERGESVSCRGCAEGGPAAARARTERRYEGFVQLAANQAPVRVPQRLQQHCGDGVDVGGALARLCARARVSRTAHVGRCAWALRRAGSERGATSFALWRERSGTDIAARCRAPSCANQAAIWLTSSMGAGTLNSLGSSVAAAPGGGEPAVSGAALKTTALLTSLQQLRACAFDELAGDQHTFPSGQDASRRLLSLP